MHPLMLKRYSVMNVCCYSIYIRQLRATFRLIRVFFKHESRKCKMEKTHSCGLFIHSYFKYIFKMFIYFMGWRGREQEIRGAKRIPGCSEMRRYHRLSTLRFIPEGDEVPRVLIHLLSRILRKHASRLRASSITMTAMSDSLCAPLLKCSATGDSSVLRCVMSYR